MQLQRPGVAYRALAGTSLQCETSLVWRENAPPVVQRFVEHVRGRQQRQSRPSRKAGAR
jgi:hypothetical protein